MGLDIFLLLEIKNKYCCMKSKSKLLSEVKLLFSVLFYKIPTVKNLLQNLPCVARLQL